jgi:hypothetical protein
LKTLQWIGFSGENHENLLETMDFPMKYGGKILKNRSLKPMEIQPEPTQLGAPSNLSGDTGNAEASERGTPSRSPGISRKV